MDMQKAADRGANALKKELVVRSVATSKAPAARVYEVLADLRTHLTWAGEQQKEKTRLVSIEAPQGPARVGTEFHTEGIDPMGTFSDRSVITEATPGRVLEFVTDARLATKGGKQVDWTNVHRYDLTPEADGCRIEYTLRVSWMSDLPGMLATFRVPGLRALALKASASMTMRGVENLAALAERADEAA
jgi:uncharacterized protein YndB with AHSA1/START domain